MTVIDPDDPIDRDGGQAEDAVAGTLLLAGWDEVINLNREVADHFPAVDQAARNGATRVLIQVRGVTNDDGNFTTYPRSAHRAMRLGKALGLPVLFAFRHLTADGETLRFGTAARVAELAEAAEAEYPGKNRFHVNIDDFEVDVNHIKDLLDPPT